MSTRIGIDVGGTNTDAVLMDGERVLGEVKTPTTPDVTSGIVTALRKLVVDSQVQPGRVMAVMIGTTHFTNAVVEAKRLMATAAIRLGLPATQALPPMVDWPQRLKQAIGNHTYMCHGGHEFDGRLISELDTQELREVAEDIGKKGIRSIAISSVFSPVNAEMELEAARFFEQQLPGVMVSVSHEIGRIGLLERENATIMNACLRDLAVREPFDVPMRVHRPIRPRHQPVVVEHAQGSEPGPIGIAVPVEGEMPPGMEPAPVGLEDLPVPPDGDHVDLILSRGEPRPHLRSRPGLRSPPGFLPGSGSPPRARCPRGPPAG